MIQITKWDRRFLELAHNVGKWSKEPRSNVGAVIVRPDRTIASMGYNGFPRGVIDSPERLANRELKNKIAIHAEQNAILSSGESLKGYTIYVTPLWCCSQCAGAIIQSGITRVIAECGHTASQDWLDSAKLSAELFNEAGVSYLFINKANDELLQS